MVAKALALECMRAAKAQERNCYVFAFAGPQEVGVLAVGQQISTCLTRIDLRGPCADLMPPTTAMRAGARVGAQHGPEEREQPAGVPGEGVQRRVG